MSKEEEDTAVERPNFTGVWVLVRMENHDAFMKARGANFIMRKAAKALKLTHTITHNGNDFHVITTANVPFFPKQEIHGVIDGPPIEQKDMMTKKMVSYTTTWDGDQMHVIGTGLPKPMEMRRSMRGGQMVMEMMYNGVTMTHYYDKKAE